MKLATRLISCLAVAVSGSVVPPAATAQPRAANSEIATQDLQQPRAVAPTQSDADLPVYLRDRGKGVALSMFGSYAARGELIVYPYWEYYVDNNREYNPSEFGFAGQQDFRGRYRASEGLFFVAYGITDRLAVQTEVAVIRASIEKSPADLSAMPPTLQASGLGSFETQLRWKWREEDDRRPELWSYLDVVFPTNQQEPLIGTLGWETELGLGVTRGFTWGTLTARVSAAYDSASTTTFDTGEYAVEYLKRVSPSWRFFAAIQGHGTALSLITEAQWHVTRHVFIRFNQEVGLTSTANDWEPQLGILFTLPIR